MASIAESHPETWITATLARLWPNERVLIELLKGDASNRRFWRVRPHKANRIPASAIAIDLGAEDLPLYARALKLLPEPLPEPPWLNLHRFLTKLGVAVPAILAFDPGRRMLLVEDVGSLPLFEAAQNGEAGDFYRLAADELMRFHINGSQQLDANCLAARISYDQRLFRWELEQFVETGIGKTPSMIEHNALAAELDQLAARLDRFPRVFSHRDYHGHNLFVQYDEQGRPRLRVIDFQDALMAPAAQDLSVLLTTRDTARVITPVIERRMLDYYYAALIRRQAPLLPFAEFHESYRLCVLQHALKVIGRFTVLERSGKSGYQGYIPFALGQARRMLAQSDDFPTLRAVLGPG